MADPIHTDELRALRPQASSRGSNQSGVRLYNERLILSLIRRHGGLPKAELARLTGLSMQASSVITAELERAGLVIRGEPVRGRVGQPSVPLVLNPEGAFSLGFKFGRRTADLVLMDLVGAVRDVRRVAYAYPTPHGMKAFLAASLEGVLADLSPVQRGRIRGLGVSVPLEMWSWEAELGAPGAVIDAWRRFDIRREIEALSPWPVHLSKDATAACAAEFTFGLGTQYRDHLYVFIAALVGGGLVIDGRLHPGTTGYAGSLGSMLVPGRGDGEPQRLVRRASLSILEAMMKAAGQDTAIVWRSDADWSAMGGTLGAWIEAATDSLAYAVGSAVSVIDFQAVIIDGAFPPEVRGRVVERTRAKVAALRMEGVAPVEIVSGTIGSDARVLGAASLPLIAGYARDTDVLLSATA